MAGRRVGSLGCGELGHSPSEWRDDHSAREIGVGEIELRLRDRALRFSDLTLRRKYGELPLCLEERRLSRVEGGLLLDQVGVRLLRLLKGTRPLLEQRLSASVLVLRIAERCLRLGRLQRHLINRSLLFDGLGLGGGDRRLGLRDLRLALRLSRPKIAIVEADQRLARLHDLVVRHGNVNDRSGNLSADLARPCVNEGVVSVLEMPGVQPPRDADCAAGNRDKDEKNGRKFVGRNPQSFAMRGF